MPPLRGSPGGFREFPGQEENVIAKNKELIMKNFDKIVSFDLNVQDKNAKRFDFYNGMEATMEGALEIAESMDESSVEGLAQNPDVQQKAKDALLQYLRAGIPISISRFVNLFKIQQDFLSLPEVKEKAKVNLLAGLASGYYTDVLNEISIFNFPQDFLHSPEIKKALLQGIISMVGRGYGLESLWKEGGILSKLNYPLDFLQSLEVKEAVKSGILQMVEVGKFLPDIQHSSKELIEKNLLEEEFLLSEEVKKAVKERVISDIELSHNLFLDTELALEKLQEFNIAPEFLKSKEVEGAAQKGFIQSLSSFTNSEMGEIVNVFGFSSGFLGSPEVMAVKRKSTL